jgi:hypothetical protein
MSRVWGKRESCTGFWWENLRERDQREDPGIDGKIILGWIFRNLGCGGMDWIGLAQDRERWRAIVSAVMKLRIPYTYIHIRIYMCVYTMALCLYF